MANSPSKTVAIIGKTGQLAQVLSAEAAIHHIKTINLGREACDLTAPDTAILAALSKLPKVDALINAAAYTQVDQAESEPEAAMQINGHAPSVFAQFCQSRDIPFIHISTDYVFDGRSKIPYQTHDITNPINVYGQSKLIGETATLAYSRGTVLRASWLFDGYGQNFFTKMISLAKDTAELRIVSDQIGRPVDTTTLAKACFAVVNNPKSGLYHISGNGPPTSWAGFAKAIFSAAPTAHPLTVKVTDIPAKDYPTAAKRPAYSVLDNMKFEADYGVKLEDWRDMIDLAWTEYIGA